MSDIKFILNTHGHSSRGGIVVSPSQLARLPSLAFQEIYSALNTMGKTLNLDLKFYFYKMIHERPRNAEYNKGRPELLLNRMMNAFMYEVQGDANLLRLVVFNVDMLDMATRDEGYNTHGRGWAMRFIDGHEGRRHGGEGWGFIEHDYAMKLAKECANEFISTERKKEVWLTEIDHVFKGRHGEGIMVRLDKPLFFMFPKFGLAKKFVNQHPGFMSWPAIGLVGQEMTRRDGWVADELQDALDRAIAKM